MFAKCTINDITFIFICTFIVNYLLQFAINQNATQSENYRYDDSFWYLISNFHLFN